MPTKGTLNTCDANAHSVLADATISPDNMAVGMHEEKQDMRDEPPTVIMMVVALPKDTHLSKSPWKTSGMVVSGHCSIGPHPPHIHHGEV